MSYNKDKIKQSLSIEDVHSLVADLGGDPQPIKGNYFISRTICHNPPGQGSYKLYYYDNGDEGIFHCYTECTEGSFDIFELVRKQKTISTGQEWTLFQAIVYVAQYFGVIPDEFGENQEETALPDWNILEHYEENNQEANERIIDLRVYNENILKYLPTPRILPWEKEGISRDVMLHRGIAYDSVNQGIIIPHYDINGRLIGIRERTLIKEQEKNGKYKPAIIDYKMYGHSLSFNLYNLNNSKNQIRRIRKAIVGEGEKLTLQYASFFGEENDISVAVCGSNFTDYQIQLLLSLGVEEIVIAFDKQFKEIGDEEFENWTKKLTNIYKKCIPYVTTSIMFDKWNLLDYKDSPTDKNKDVFMELYNRRIYL